MIQLAKIFQSGMTLQRGKPIRIWGSTNHPQQIYVTINNCIWRENIQIEDDFEFFLPDQEAMMDATIVIRGEVDTIELTNVDIGEVWIAGGQSNMEFLLRYDVNSKSEIAAANDCHLRYYDVGEYTFPEEKALNYKDSTGWDKWLQYTPEHAEYFSAVGTYFAKQLRESLNVPIALVGCNWGGTSASSWMDQSYLNADPELSEYIEDYRHATKNLVVDDYLRQHDAHLKTNADPKVAEVVRNTTAGTVNWWMMLKSLPEWRKMGLHQIPMGPRNQNAPGCLFNAMVRQIAGYTCRGVIWYQGESDDHKPQMYDKLFASLIRCWRDAWKEELPFLFVQLAPFGKWMGVTGEKYPILRHKQEIVSKTVPQCYMASIMDVGMEKDIHPKNKRPVGERLALLARGKVYGEDISCDAPEFDSVEIQSGKILMRFVNSYDGLTIRGKNLNAMQIIVDGRKLKVREVSAEGDTLCICGKHILADSKVKVDFAWSGYCKVNLYNSAGLSAKPFQFG